MRNLFIVLGCVLAFNCAQATVEEVNKEGNPVPQLLSQGLRVSAGTDMIYISGQIPLDPVTHKIMDGDIATLTNQVIDQLEVNLKAAGSDLQHVIRVEIFVKDMKDMPAIEPVYIQRFQNTPMPVRQTHQVAGLYFDSPIEISCIAYPIN